MSHHLNFSIKALQQVDVSGLRIDAEYGSLVAADDGVLYGGVVACVGVDGRHFADRFGKVAVDGVIFGDVDVINPLGEHWDVVVLVDQVHEDSGVRAQAFVGRSVV